MSGISRALSAVAYAGCTLSVLLLLAGWIEARWERTALVLLYSLYLSLYHAGQHFTNFQWDYLLLEAGFLAIFLPGWPAVHGLALPLAALSPAFPLRDLQAPQRRSHVERPDRPELLLRTQPLPHAGAWYAHQLPEWLLRLGTAGTLVVEILVPFINFLLTPLAPRGRLADHLVAGSHPAHQQP